MEINKKSVILLSNNEEVIENFKATLASKFNVYYVKSGNGIFFTFEETTKTFSLIFADLDDRDIDLKEFLQTKKKDPSHVAIPVIGISKRKRVHEALLSNGVTDCLDFPIANLQLVNAHIDRIIELSEKGQLVPYADNSTLVTPAVRIIDLYKSYGPKEVLKGLNLEVYNGELFGFIGRNGIGKSTTIDCMIGVKRFNSGTIEIEGYSIKEEPLIAKSRFGYVASEPTCYESMTGYEYLEFIASVYKISEAEFAGNVEYLAKRLVLSDDDLDKSIANYSHGMKQKLCLIASLLNNPDVWILDEPTVGLDIMAVEELKKMMREYANHGKCVYITSHNIDIIAKICDRVAIINDGVVVELLDLNKDPNKRLQLPRIFLNIFGVNQ